MFDLACSALAHDWRNSPRTRFFRSGDDAVKPLRDALNKPVGAVGDDTWRVGVLRELRALVDTCLPWPLPAPSRPGEGEPTPPDAALHYRMAAEFVCRFPTRGGAEYQSFVSTGMLLDLWDIWRKAGSTHEIERRPLEQGPPLGVESGRVVNPALILDAICGCDRDLSFLLCEDGAYGAEDALHEQIKWQLRHLCLSKDPFSNADRAVLYELLRHDHYRFSDAETHWPEDSVERMILAARDFQTSIENFGETALPQAPEGAFADKRADRAQQDRTIDALRIFFAHGASGEGDRAFDTLPRRLQTSAKKLGIDVDEANLRRMLLFWAARSRIVRMALDDLLDHRFPNTESKAPEQQKMDAVSGCDCWIAVTGHRQVGKTSFMTALATALLPDETPLDGELENVRWSESRARIVETSAFSQAGTRDEALNKATRGVDQLIVQRLRGAKTAGTPEEIQHIAEVDTAYLARLRFFDLPGEHLYDEATGKMNDQTEEMIKQRGPVAAIFLESADDDDRQPGRRRFLPEIVGPDAPVYIVMNKYDAFRDRYRGAAKGEMLSSLSYEDAPAESDADFGMETEPFFSLRQLDLGREDVTNHHDIIKRLDDVPAVVRRPYYHARLVADIERLGWLFDDYLLKWGNRDISISYLVSTLDGRAKPKEFRGLRRLWDDIEYRVVESTRDVRRSALRRLLMEGPAEAERRAAEAYDNFNPAFEHEVDSKDDQLGQLPGYWDRFKVRVTEGLEHLQRETQHVRHMFWGTTCYNPHEATMEALEEVKRALAYSDLIASKQARVSAIRNALTEFLPEFGVNKDSGFDEIPVISRVRALDPVILGKLKDVTGVICEQIQETLRDHELPFEDEIGPRVTGLLETIIIEPGGNEDANKHLGLKKENKFRVHFDVRNGVEHPNEHPSHGVPLRGRTLNLKQRKILSRSFASGETVAEEILNQSFADEALALVLALYNSDESCDARYPDLMLRKGDVDFGRVRVLSERHQLGERSREFREKAVEAMELLLQAHARLRRRDAESLASLKLLQLIDAKIFGGNLALADAPSTSGDEANKTLAGLRERLAEHHEKAKELRRELQAVLDGRRLLGRRWDRVRNIGIELPRTWSVLDADSRPSMSNRWKRKVIKGRTRIEVKARLLEELVEIANVLAGAEEERTQEDGMGNGWQLDAALRHKLLELRLLRRLLVVGYPLKYLFENQWIQSAKEVAAREASARPGKANAAVTEIANKLEKASQALNKMNLRFEVADAQAKEWSGKGSGNGDRSERIGAPAFPLVALKEDETTGRSWIDDDQGNWMALCDALGLWEVRSGEHPLWQGRE